MRRTAVRQLRQDAGVACQVSVGNEFSGLHAHQKIRNGSKLQAVQISGHFCGLAKFGVIQQDRAGSIQRGVSFANEFMPGKIREDSLSDGGFQIGMGGKGTG